MTVSRWSQLGALLFCFLICVGCGDVYRPTIIPNPVPIPPPQNFHTAFAVNQNGSAYPGTGMQVDVSGDTNAGVTKVAMQPVHATVQGAKVWVANNLSNSVSAFSESQGSGIGASTDINLPVGYAPVFVHSTETSTMYAASVSAANPDGAPGVVAAISSANVVTNVLTVGRHPIALAETPDGKKLYVANRAEGTVTVINIPDKTINVTLPAGVSPTWAIARSDSARVYVLSQNDGLLTTFNPVPPTDTALSTINVGAGAESFYYDSRLNRLYIPNPTNSTVAIYDVTSDPPHLLATVTLTNPVTPGGTDSPCPATGCAPLSVAPLPDGSRAYIASYYLDNTSPNCTVTACVQAQVTVINALTNQVIKAIPLPEVSVSSVGNCASARFRIASAASVDSSRVYVSTCDGGGVASVRTSDNTYVVTLPAPVSGFTPPAVNITSAVQNGSSTTYTYTMISGIPLFLGLPITVTGIADPGDTGLNPDNGTFNITGLGAGTFTVTNPNGVSTTTGQAAFGLGQPPPQNPVFMIAGP